MSRLTRVCDECDRIFDLADDDDAQEWHFGHDCEVEYEDDVPDAGHLQILIDTGLAWQLEGSVGRECMAAIEDGRCTLGPVGHRDYWGNYVPAIHEVQPGSLGSAEYAANLQGEFR